MEAGDEPFLTGSEENRQQAGSVPHVWWQWLCMYYAATGMNYETWDIEVNS